MKLKEKYF